MRTWHHMNDLECGWWDVKGTPSIPWPDLSHRWVQRCCAEKVTCNSKVLKRALIPKSRRNEETEVQYTENHVRELQLWTSRTREPGGNTQKGVHQLPTAG